MIVGGSGFGEVGNCECLAWVCWYSVRGVFEWGVVCVWGDYVAVSLVVGVGGYWWVYYYLWCRRACGGVW